MRYWRRSEELIRSFNADESYVRLEVCLRDLKVEAYQAAS